MNHHITVLTKVLGTLLSVTTKLFGHKSLVLRSVLRPPTVSGQYLFGLVIAVILVPGPRPRALHPSLSLQNSGMVW
jgi:hypothetical protein